MTATAAERLAAGLDADEADIQRRWGSLANTQWVRRPHREVAAKRRILALYEEYQAKAERQQLDESRGDPIGRVDPFVRSATRVLGEAVSALAAVYEEAEETQ